MHEDEQRQARAPPGVGSVIEQYKAETGIALPKVDVRAEVCEKMGGRDTT
jgi:hypothetical protein